MSDVFSKNQKIIVHVPLHVRKWGGKRVVVGPQGQDLRHLDLQIRKDEKLLKALARAYRWQKHLLTGRYKNMEEMAVAEKINKSYMQRMMRLMLLSPKIIESILDGNQPDEFGLADVEKPFSPLWCEQEQHFGFSSVHN
jgi:hypothetical protein